MKIKLLCGTTAVVGCPSYEYKPGYVFTEDARCDDYDWLVVYEELSREKAGTLCGGYEPLACPKERTILCTWEPTSIKSYSRAYTRQFGHLLTNRPPEAECHSHYHLGRGYFVWFIERTPQEVRATVIPAKTKLVSAVCSAKQMTHTRHADRLRLMRGLTAGIPELDWYGRGIRSFGRKVEVLDPYKYHVVAENHVGAHHWTEKLADAFLCECLPFYAGDPAIFEVFPRESLIPIPMDDPDEAVRIVRAAIAEGAYEKRREAVLEAKRLVLEKYNFWAQVISVIETERNQPVTPVDPDQPFRIWNRKALRRHSLSAMMDDGWHHFRGFMRMSRMRAWCESCRGKVKWRS